MLSEQDRVRLTERLAEYRRVTDQAFTAYMQVQGQARTVLDQARNLALTEYNRTWPTPPEAYVRYKAATDQAYAAYGSVRDQASGEYDRVEDQAFGAIAEGMPALVQWIVNNCLSYRYEALACMDEIASGAALSISSLDHLAAEEEWCEVWDKFRASAIADGVITEES